MVFLTNIEKLTQEKDMVPLGIGTQTHVINVSVHLSPLRYINGSISSSAAVRPTCQKPLRLSIMIFYLRWAMHSRVFPML